MTELPNSVKVSSIDKSFTKYKNNLLSTNENKRNQKNEIEHHKELFFEYLLFHIYLFIKSTIIFKSLVIKNMKVFH